MQRMVKEVSKNNCAKNIVFQKKEEIFMSKKTSSFIKFIAAALIFMTFSGAVSVQPTEKFFNYGITASAETAENIEIASSEDWDDFANDVSSYNGKTLVLKDDITISKRAGSKTVKFQGTFDGNGHTLTLAGGDFGTADAPNTKKYCSPFSYTDSVTIKNLTVAGEIYTELNGSSSDNTAGKFASGLIGSVNGDSTIENCHICITLHSLKAASVQSDSVDGTHGMFIGVLETNKNVKINNSYFDGLVYAESTINCGGFVGYNKGKVDFSNCLFAPAAIESYHGNSTDYTTTFARLVNNDTKCSCTFENTYYTTNWGKVDKGAIYADINNPVDISNAVITLSEDSFVYDGLEKSVTYTAKLGEIPLTEGKDFVFEGDLTATASDTYIVKIKGKTVYGGEAYTTWKIVTNFDVNVYIDGNYSGSTSYSYSQLAALKAPEIEGKTFSHWEIDDKKVSISPNYSFVVLGKTDVKAVYNMTKETQENPILTVSAFKTMYNKKNAVRFVYNRSISEEYYKVNQVGIIYGTNNLLGVSGHPSENLIESSDYEVSGRDAVIDALKTKKTVKKFVGKSKLNEGTVELKYAVGNNTDAYVYAMGYVKVTNTVDGTEEIFYTDVIATTYNNIL